MNRDPVVLLASLIALQAWICSPPTANHGTVGAELPAEDGVTVATSAGSSPDWAQRRYQPEQIWAYQPIRKPVAAAPAGMKADGVADDSTAIDRLLALRQSAEIALAPRAEPIQFVRRVTFDLTGLPPTPEEVREFLADWQRTDGAPETYARLVDRLLASPHYGERMAQHWLDVVRYADSSGLANDFERGNAWRYRDYVVRSFNDDKPYDQFVREQLAGDELAPDDPELLIATGFLRMGPWELTAMEVAKLARQRFLDDVTNSVGETFLAHSLQCARCHDHKFDPVPTRDYYAVQAVFATTQLAERPAPFLSRENRSGFEEARFLERSRSAYLEILRQLDDKALRAAEVWLQDRQIDPEPWRAAVAQATPRPRGTTFAAARGILLRQGVPEDRFPPRMLGWTPAEIGLERVANKGLERLAWAFERYQPYALSVYSGRTPRLTSVTAPTRIPANHLTQGELEQTCLLAGGDPFSATEPVPPGVLSAVGLAPPHPIPTQIAGRRRAFAEWVASPQNPLTVRAIVNRIWLWHFGRPLAGNPNNFGSTGKPPTHPELLDWLSATFLEEGWSIKALHRRIMNSAAYRRSTEHPAAARLAALDPLGTSYAVFLPRRLTAEELRDAMLLVSGELNPVLGGIPNRPELPLDVALQPRQVMGTFAAAWTPNPLPAQRHRRSLYALKLRGLLDPFREVFNAPAPDFSCERRETATITPQALSLFNAAASHARARALAARAIQEARAISAAGASGAAPSGANWEERALVRCFELALSRAPTADERTACLAHWRETSSRLESPPPAVAYPRSVRRDAIEENTGERFSYLERLDAYEEFVPDLQPSDLDAPTRALADVCLVLLNTNEFIYVY